MTHTTGSRVWAMWRVDLDAHLYGWHIDADGLAHKENLTVTKHLLRDLVNENGWRGAERIIIDVEARRAPS